MKRMMKRLVILIAVVALVSGANASDNASNKAPDNASNKAGAEDKSGYAYGPVTEVQYIHVYYGHFEEYMKWITSTWLPTMQALKKAGLIVDYKIFRSEDRSPDQANFFIYITYKNMAAFAGDIGDGVDAFEAVTEKVICSSDCQNQARVRRNELRKNVGTEIIREITFAH